MRSSRYLFGASALLFAGCTVGPDYQKPSVPMSDVFKESVAPAAYRTAGPWNAARPGDQLPRGKWWTIFGDPVLNSLEDQLTQSNQSLKIAEARYRQARAELGIQGSVLYPTLSVGGTINSFQESGQQPYVLNDHPTSSGLFQLPLSLSYEVDLWGRVHRTVSAAREEAQATAADLATADLSLHAELAIDYIELRAADAQEKLLNDTVAAFTHALTLTQNRLAGGEAPESDVAQAQTQLDTTRVQATDIGVSRAQFEHAIAILLGEPPAQFTLPPAPLDLAPPPMPPMLPSELLERRPDIAAAERRTAEANEQIGIAQAAYYPSVNLSGSGGFEGKSLATWFGWPSLFWAVGPTASETLLDGGLRASQVRFAEAGYDAAVANYRQTTLTAFQQVEDNLAALRILADEAIQQKEAVDAAENSLRIFTNRYVGGEDAYLQVITAQTFALTNERNDVDIRRRRVEASILLVKALGGGWNATTDLPALKEASAR